MERKILFRPFLSLLILFFLINIVLMLLKICLVQNIEYPVLFTGNAVLFLASLLSFYLYRRALLGNNAHVFLRFVYGGMFLKMGICLAAALMYIILTGGEVSKTAVLECFGLYFLYTFVEVKILMRLSKLQKNV